MTQLLRTAGMHARIGASILLLQNTRLKRGWFSCRGKLCERDSKHPSDQFAQDDTEMREAVPRDAFVVRALWSMHVVLMKMLLDRPHIGMQEASATISPAVVCVSPISLRAIGVAAILSVYYIHILSFLLDASRIYGFLSRSRKLERAMFSLQFGSEKEEKEFSVRYPNSKAHVYCSF